MLRLLRADGSTPLANCDARVRAGDRTLERKSDADGRIVLDPAPYGELTIDAGELKAGPISLPAGEREATLDVVMSAR